MLGDLPHHGHYAGLAHHGLSRRRREGRDCQQRSPRGRVDDHLCHIMADRPHDCGGNLFRQLELAGSQRIMLIATRTDDCNSYGYDSLA